MGRDLLKNSIFFLIMMIIILLVIRFLTFRTFLYLSIIIALIFLNVILVRDIQQQLKKKIMVKSVSYFNLLEANLMNDHGKLLEWISQYEKSSIVEDNSLFPNNMVEIIDTSEETLEKILSLLDQAEHHVHLEYFIIKDGKIAENVKQLLLKKLGEGVKVRIIYDGFGSFLLKNSFINELREAGAEVKAFSAPIQSILKLSANHRNHRKILVVDGHTGIIGGSNIGDEYFGRRTQLGKWKDTDIVMKGEAVHCLQAIFLKDWYLISGQTILDPSYYPIMVSGYIPMTIVTGGNDSPVHNIEKLYLSLIDSAQTKLYLQTPYLVPTEPIIKNIENAVVRGVDVKIIIPTKSDNIIAQYATKIAARNLSLLGVEIYEYDNGFLHSKIAVRDDNLAIVSTANLDYRGFRLDYEVVAIVHDQKVNDDLKMIFLSDLNHSNPINIKMKLSFIDKIGEGLIKMIEGIL